MKKSISVLGGGYFQPGSWEYHCAYRLGVLLEEDGFTEIVCGGYNGIMEAIAAGAIQSVTGITLPDKPQGNSCLSKTIEANDYYDRLRRLMATDVHVYFSGKDGSMVELVTDLSLVYKLNLKKTLIGCYQTPAEWNRICMNLIALNFSADHLELVKVVHSAEAVMELILKCGK